MKAIIPIFDESSKRAYYLQLYDYIKESILTGEMMGEEKLPSLRSLSKTLKISITTVELAYNQLAVEGYIFSKPQSGYYVSDLLRRLPEDLRGEPPSAPEKGKAAKGEGSVAEQAERAIPAVITDRLMAKSKSAFQYDLSCFDFNKWKKSMNKVLTDYPDLLLFESNPQGEEALRYQIADYLYRSRGVSCTPGQIVIGAGTQQIMGLLSLLLTKQGIHHVSFEDPGYLPVRSIFRDRGFTMSLIPVQKDGVAIEKLPTNIRSALYVSPSNQFPTGALMPVGRRYQLLKWAEANNSLILEDDYDSELRYSGKPVPALQGLDKKGLVVYLGSFSSTLFPSLKISYMVLPKDMATLFAEIGRDYTQTCSKLEQLTLALFIEQGLYQINLKKLRSLYAQKLTLLLSSFQKYGKGFVTPINATSGINIILSIKSSKSADQLCKEAATCGINTLPVAMYADTVQKGGGVSLIFYYHRIPMEGIDRTVKDLIYKWRGWI